METGVNAMQTVSAIRQLWTEAGQYEEAARASEKIALVKMRQLSSAVLSGEATTGSSFSDYVLVNCDSVQMKYVLKLQELERQISEHAGELILAVHSQPDRSFLSDTDDIVVVKFCLTVLTGDKLDVSKSKCEFPTCSRMVQKWANASEILVDCRLGFNSWTRMSILQLDQPMDSKDRLHNFWIPEPKVGQVGQLLHLPRKKLEVVIGNQPVHDWFASRGLESTFDSLELTLSVKGHLHPRIQYP